MKVEIHRITKCGFYARSQTQALFGHAPAWSAAFGEWISQRPNVAATTTFDPPNGQAKTFCAAWSPDANGYGMVLWHSMPSTATGVAYISQTAAVGAVAATEERLPVNSIPGWPSYFWVLPQAQLVVALRPAGRVRNIGSGLPALRDYLRSYLEGHSFYVVVESATEADDGNSEARDIVGWRSHPSAASRTDLSIYVDTEPLETPCELDLIRSRREEIRKLVQSFQATRALPEERTRLEQALALGGWYPGYKTPEQDRLSFRWETDWQPDDTELEDLIAAVAGRAAVHGRRKRAGVRFSGDTRLHWLDAAPVSVAIPLPERLESVLTWSQQQLQEAWELTRDQVATRLRATNADAAI